MEEVARRLLPVAQRQAGELGKDGGAALGHRRRVICQQAAAVVVVAVRHRHGCSLPGHRGTAHCLGRPLQGSLLLRRGSWSGAERLVQAGRPALLPIVCTDGQLCRAMHRRRPCMRLAHWQRSRFSRRPGEPLAAGVGTICTTSRARGASTDTCASPPASPRGRAPRVPRPRHLRFRSVPMVRLVVLSQPRKARQRAPLNAGRAAGRCRRPRRRRPRLKPTPHPRRRPHPYLQAAAGPAQITATTQQSRFHAETLETPSQDVDLKQLHLQVAGACKLCCRLLPAPSPEALEGDTRRS